MSTAILTEKLCCQSGERYLLKDINWQVNCGEHWLVFGANGSGKTTLLSIIAGYRAYSSGMVQVMGHPFDDACIFALRKKIGWVSSSFFDQALHQEAILDIVLSGYCGGLNRDFSVDNATIRQAKKLLTMLGLGKKTGYPFALLSKGERQNVLLARALLAQPDILVLDEPSAGLDILAREYFLTMLAALAQETTMTIIFVTHYTDEIIDAFDQCLLLRQGQVFRQGVTKDLFTSEIMSDFLEQPIDVLRENQRFRLALSAQVDLKSLLGNERRDPHGYIS